MPTYGFDVPDWRRPARPGVGRGKGRGVTKPLLRRGRNKRRR